MKNPSVIFQSKHLFWLEYFFSPQIAGAPDLRSSVSLFYYFIQKKDLIFFNCQTFYYIIILFKKKDLMFFCLLWAGPYQIVDIKSVASDDWSNRCPHSLSLRTWKRGRSSVPYCVDVCIALGADLLSFLSDQIGCVPYVCPPPTSTWPPCTWTCTLCMPSSDDDQTHDLYAHAHVPYEIAH